MHDEAHVRLVHAHAEADRCHDDRDRVVEPALLDALPRVGPQAGVVWRGGDIVTGEKVEGGKLEGEGERGTSEGNIVT